jgi:hypothetical protein
MNIFENAARSPASERISCRYSTVSMFGVRWRTQIRDPAARASRTTDSDRPSARLDLNAASTLPTSRPM